MYGWQKSVSNYTRLKFTSALFMKLIKVKLLTIIFMVPHFLGAQKPIALHPDNPHYFIYKEKPTVLITSGEHYGAVLNLDFDYRTYLDELASEGLNLTRTFTGAYVEPEGAFKIEQNTLAPLPERFICPWARSVIPGYANGGNKFDLRKWDNTYFTRLKDFVAYAEKKGVVVELALFCPFYEDIQWNISPMNTNNNVNGLGTVERTQVYTLDEHGGLLEIQEDLVRKIVNELNDYSNIIYEICNEPYFGGVTMEWQHRIADLIKEEENNLKIKHLISQNIENGSSLIKEPHEDVSVFNFHYANPPVTVGMNYHLNKVIGDNETGFDGNSDSTYRKEGWQFILAGGALYNNLDYSFTAQHEDGTFKYPSTQPGGGSATLRKQLHYLKDFMDRLDFIRMKPDSTVVVSGVPAKGSVYVLAETGKQYALYIFGSHQVNLTLNLPAGQYKAEWLNPLNGGIWKAQKIKSDGKVTLKSPEYAEDIALRITK